ncbi:MAG: protein-L-isoaspartate(D-aspartate) O-methyltransferase [Chloroflexota bacterium]|nr:protein-L-isoaspartate(D-aspartate) O-methyltransferase [Chloroflexota bacterium]
MKRFPYRAFPQWSWLLLLVVLVAGCSSPLSFLRREPKPTATPSPVPTQTPPESQLNPALAEEIAALLVPNRLAMVEDTIRSRGVSDPDVLRAMETIPRDRFVLPEHIKLAYDDHPLPIGYGQTISQPYIVALMTEMLQLDPQEKVLEIGTGSGYQAAVLAELVDEVYTIEIVPELYERSTNLLDELGYDQVHTRQGDGYYGWPEEAPFDAIIVTAAPDHVPQPLVQQLKDGGRLIVPVGPQGGFQSLWQIVRNGDELDAENMAPVRFVPLVGAGQGGGQAPGDRLLDPPSP